MAQKSLFLKHFLIPTTVWIEQSNAENCWETSGRDGSTQTHCHKYIRRLIAQKLWRDKQSLESSLLIRWFKNRTSHGQQTQRHRWPVTWLATPYLSRPHYVLSGLDESRVDIHCASLLASNWRPAHYAKTCVDQIEMLKCYAYIHFFKTTLTSLQPPDYFTYGPPLHMCETKYYFSFPNDLHCVTSAHGQATFSGFIES